MARIRKHFSYADTRAELVERKDMRRGASEDAFWDEDELVDYRPRRKKFRRPREGCPGNDGKSHVYVWAITDFGWNGRKITWKDYEGNHYYDEWLICCGCRARAPYKRNRPTYRRVYV